MGNLRSVHLFPHHCHSATEKGANEDFSVIHQSELSSPAAETDAASTSCQHSHKEYRPHYAGRHVILDMWEASHLDDKVKIEHSLREAAHRAGAHILHLHIHCFEDNGGISGIVALAESHISVHTWPEYGYAAFDIFMCGAARPWAAVETLREIFKPARMTANEHMRGLTLE